MHTKGGDSQHKVLLTTAIFELFIFNSVDQLTYLYLSVIPLAQNVDSAQGCSQLFQEFTAQIPLLK